MSILKSSYATLEEVPETYRALYEEAPDGTYQMAQVEGMVPTPQLDATKTSLKAARTAEKTMKAKLEAEATAKAQAQAELDELRTVADNVDDDADAGKLARKIRLTEKKLEKAQLQIDQLAARDTENKAELAKRGITDALTKATRGKVRDEHVDDVLLRAGQFVYDDEGNVVHGETAEKPEEWLKGLLPQKPAWIPGNTPAGARGKTTPSGTKKLSQMTPEEKLTLSPAQYQELASAEGLPTQ